MSVPPTPYLHTSAPFYLNLARPPARPHARAHTLAHMGQPPAALGNAVPRGTLTCSKYNAFCLFAAVQLSSTRANGVYGNVRRRGDRLVAAHLLFAAFTLCCASWERKRVVVVAVVAAAAVVVAAAAGDRSETTFTACLYKVNVMEPHGPAACLDVPAPIV